MRLAYRHPNPNRNPTPSAGRPPNRDPTPSAGRPPPRRSAAPSRASRPHRPSAARAWPRAAAPCAAAPPCVRATPTPARTLHPPRPGRGRQRVRVRPRLTLIQPKPEPENPNPNPNLEVGGGGRERRRVLRAGCGAHDLPVRAATRRALELELAERQPCAGAPLLGCRLEPAPRGICVLRHHLTRHEERTERALALGIAVCRRALDLSRRRFNRLRRRRSSCLDGRLSVTVLRRGIRAAAVDA